VISAPSSVKPAYFRQCFERARFKSEQVRNATSDFHAERGAKYFVWSNGTEYAGCVVRPDGELTNVFSTIRGMGDRIVRFAIEHGAVYLDCFDGYLPTFYARHGFVTVATVPNWTPGGPDVVYMSLPGFESRHGVATS
jgi:hypothetical protein